MFYMFYKGNAIEDKSALWAAHPSSKLYHSSRLELYHVCMLPRCMFVS